MRKINPTDEISMLYDDIKIFWEEDGNIKGVQQYNFHQYGDVALTFDMVKDVAIENGYRGGMLTVIADSPMAGKIYAYGNYGDVWYEYGTTKGYA